MLINIGNAALSHSEQTIAAAWTQHYDDLRGARGISVVDDPSHQLRIPGDVDLGPTGFLRCLMGSRNLLNVQNIEGAREFRYSAPIFCDTNFVSYCGAFFAGRHLKSNEEGFRETVAYLLPIKQSISAIAYVLENADKVDTEKMRSSLLGFVALTRSRTSNFCSEFLQSERTGAIGRNGCRRPAKRKRDRFQNDSCMGKRAVHLVASHPRQSDPNFLQTSGALDRKPYARIVSLSSRRVCALYPIRDLRRLSISLLEFTRAILQRNPTKCIGFGGNS